MQFSIDLISDLHVDSWSQEFDWSSLATSPYCIVAGDVARDRAVLLKTLRHLGQCYQAVFYIDGNDEHVDHYTDLGGSYKELTKKINKIPNVVYLQDNVVVVEGIAILGTNGWWGYDLDPHVDSTETSEWFQNKANVGPEIAEAVRKMSHADATYMANSVAKLQTHMDVQKIIMVTHTVPEYELITHDIDLEGTVRFNTMGNSDMYQALLADHGNKIHTWCFGHYHGAVDQYRNGIRFVNNCRGREGTRWSQHVYHPRRIVVDC
jgi:predicted phosphodiesterase